MIRGYPVVTVQRLMSHISQRGKDKKT